MTGSSEIGSSAPGAGVAAALAAARDWDDPALFIAKLDEAPAATPSADGPLAGQAIAVKDNIDVAGFDTTAACPAFAYRPARSSFVVQRLQRAGATVVGKTNLDQFATGLVGVRSPYGAPRNALRADLIPGGSSSGSAAAVAAGIVPFSLGTDTAGSGRVPAGLNGIVGLKPTLGLLSATGVVPACRTLDTISIFAGTVAGAFDVLRIGAGFDAEDAFSKPLPPPRMAAPPPRLRIGVLREDQREFFGDEAAKAAYAADVDRLQSLGFDLVAFDFAPFAAVARLLYQGPWVAERYVATKAIIERNPDAMHPVTRAIIEGARRFDAASAFEAAYRLADLRRQTESAWRDFDIMAVPTVPRAYTLAEVASEPFQTNANLGAYTNFVNLLNLCAISVPSGRRDDGLPSSLTFIAAAGLDGLVAGVGARVHERSGVPIGATKRMPPPAPATVGADGGIEIAVVGAHLSGLPLNRELTALGAAFVRAATTAPEYRLFALPDTTPPKPGLLRVSSGEGSGIAVEIWSLSPAAFGSFVAAIPSPLGVGTLRFDDGTSAKGFLAEAEALRGAKDISSFGGWRAYLASR